MWHLVNGSMNILEKTKLAAWIRNIKQIFKINNTDLSKPGKVMKKKKTEKRQLKSVMSLKKAYCHWKSKNFSPMQPIFLSKNRIPSKTILNKSFLKRKLAIEFWVVLKKFKCKH